MFICVPAVEIVLIDQLHFVMGINFRYDKSKKKKKRVLQVA